MTSSPASRDLGTSRDALVSGAAELQQRVLLVSEVAAVDENVDEM